MSKNLLKMYLLSALMCAPALATNQYTQAQRLEDQATALMETETDEGIVVGSIVSTVLAELQGRQRIAPIFENLPAQSNPLVTDLVRYIANFYPALMGQVPLSHRIATAPPPPALPDDFDPIDDDWSAQPTEGFASPPSRPVATGRPQAAAAYAPSAQQQADSQAKRAEETALNQEATRLMRTGIEDNEIIAGFVLGVLDELNNKPARPRSRTIEIVSEIISDFLIKPNDLAMFFDVKIKKPFIERLIQYIRQFHPDLMRRMDSMSQEPQYAQYPRTPQEAVARGRHMNPNALRADSHEARRLQEQFNAEDAARAARNRQAQEETDRLLAREEADREARRARLAREAQAATDALLSREEAEKLARQDSEARHGEAAAHALQLQFNAERARLEVIAELDNEVSIMYEHINGRLVTNEIHEHTMQPFFDLTEFYARYVKESALTLRNKEQIQAAFRNLRDVPPRRIREITDRLEVHSIKDLSADEGMRIVQQILDTEERIRLDEIEIIARAERERVAALERNAAAARRAAEEEARRLVEQDVAIQHGSTWLVPAFAGGAEIRFDMPAELTHAGQDFIRFFMVTVEPKLRKLVIDGKIREENYNKVLRAFSMAIFGLEFQNEFKEIAVEKMNNSFDAAKRWKHINEYAIDLIDFYNDVRKKGGRLLGYTNTSPILGKLERRAAGGLALFMTLHAENYQSDIRKTINKYFDEKNNMQLDDVYDAITQYGEVLRKGVLRLPEVIRATFEKLNTSPKATDKMWVDFIQSFSTPACYDGTSNSIFEAGENVLLALDDAPVDPLKKLGEKLQKEEWKKEPENDKDKPAVAKVKKAFDDLAEILASEDGFFETIDDLLPASLKVIDDRALMNNSEALDRDYASIHERISRTTFASLRIPQGIIDEVRKELGWKPGTRDSLYTDGEILEFMFWQNQSLMAGSLMPPMIAKKYSVEQGIDPEALDRMHLRPLSFIWNKPAWQAVYNPVKPLFEEHFRDMAHNLPVALRAITPDILLRQKDPLNAEYIRFFDAQLKDKTLLSLRMDKRTVTALYKVLGFEQGQDGIAEEEKKCIFKDKEILEILFWRYYVASHPGSLMPPSVASKYSINQLPEEDDDAGEGEH